MRDLDALARGIVDGVGGAQNIRSVGHCTTRLRLVLVDKELASKEAIRALPGIMSTVDRGGQLQVVVGHDVGDVDKRVRVLVAEAHEGLELPETRLPWWQRLFDFITGTFQPLLWALVGASMVKTALAVAVQFDWISTRSGTYALWAAAGNAAFFFLPILIGITASAKLGANPYVGGVIAAALLEENFTALGAAGRSSTTFLGIPVSPIDYSQSVVPALLAAAMLAILERWLRRMLPKTLHLVLVPAICLAVLVPLTAIAFGPIGTTVANALSDGIEWVWHLSPAVAGALMGGLWQVFVMFGVHWGFVPIITNDLSVQGYSLLTGPLVAAVVAQGAASFAVFLRTRDRSLRTLAGAASVSALVAGVTEPAIYGVTLRLRRPFLYACLGGAIGGAIAAAGGSAADSFVFPGLITLPAYLSVGSFPLQALGTVTAIVVAFGLTWALFSEPPVVEAASASGDAVPATMASGAADIASIGGAGSSAPAVGAARAPAGAPGGGSGAASGPGGTTTSQDRPTTSTAAGDGVRRGAAAGAGAGADDAGPPASSHPVVRAPMRGEVVPLGDVSDPVFARGLLGPGVAIRPSSGLVRSPAAGTVRTVARARHAVGIRTEDGLDLLIHLGIDTVHLGGTPFEVLVEPGQVVASGQPIAHVELADLVTAGCDPTTPIVVTNAAAFGDVEVLAGPEVEAGALLLSIRPR